MLFRSRAAGCRGWDNRYPSSTDLAEDEIASSRRGVGRLAFRGVRCANSHHLSRFPLALGWKKAAVGRVYEALMSDRANPTFRRSILGGVLAYTGASRKERRLTTSRERHVTFTEPLWQPRTLHLMPSNRFRVAGTVLRGASLRAKQYHCQRGCYPKQCLHRSTSPNTMSSEPRIADTSASMWPRLRKSIACRCAKPGARILQR